jgi:hypothetical protein
MAKKKAASVAVVLKSTRVQQGRPYDELHPPYPPQLNQRVKHVKCERLSWKPGSERRGKAPPYRVPATPLISSSSWMGEVPAARLSEISVDVKEGMAVPAALTRIRLLVHVRGL